MTLILTLALLMSTSVYSLDDNLRKKESESPVDKTDKTDKKQNGENGKTPNDPEDKGPCDDGSTPTCSGTQLDNSDESNDTDDKPTPDGTGGSDDDSDNNGNEKPKPNGPKPCPDGSLPLCKDGSKPRPPPGGKHGHGGGGKHKHGDNGGGGKHKHGDHGDGDDENDINNSHHKGHNTESEIKGFYYKHKKIILISSGVVGVTLLLLILRKFFRRFICKPSKTEAALPFNQSAFVGVGQGNYIGQTDTKPAQAFISA